MLWLRTWAALLLWLPWGHMSRTRSSLSIDVPEESFNLVKIKILFHDLTVTELSLKTECLFFSSLGRPQMWASCLSCSGSQNGRHPPPGLVPVFWYKIRETVMFSFSPNCFYYCMFIIIYICAGFTCHNQNCVSKDLSHPAEWRHHPSPIKEGLLTLPWNGIYTRELWLLWLKEWMKAGIGCTPVILTLKKERQKDCRLKTMWATYT